MTNLLEYAEELAANDYQLAQSRRLADVDVRSIDERFRQFHEKNPQVLDRLVKLAREAISVGKKRIGAKTLVEVARWHFWLETDGDEFKINNSFTSRYARLLVETHPEFEGLFETRELRS
jgi:hypothetical protein